MTGSISFSTVEIDFSKIPSWLLRELRSDHAGECGAVYIYRGIISGSSCEDVRSLANRHLEVEREHFNSLTKIVPDREQSHLLPLWRLAGFLTGYLPALFGPDAVYFTVRSVERFVEKHYRQQINRLSEFSDMSPTELHIKSLLEDCLRDEIDHGTDALNHLRHPPGSLLRFWGWIVGKGSGIAVACARLI
jgi:ubiquinone biosynthesis monooxygenase Coq7